MEAGSRTWKVELHAIPSTTLTDRQFLTGQREAQPVTLTAALRLPPGAARVPAVILMHGSGGASGYVDEWARFLTDRGVASLMLDCFTGRGIDTTFANQEQLGRLAMIVDAYRAFDVLSGHARIDANRVVLMGFSRGGQAALYAAVRRFQDMHGPKRGGFAGYLSFYPACHIRYRSDEQLVERPIQVLHGAADDLNPIGPCREFVARARQAGANIELHEFAGARHVFDWPLLSQAVVLQGVRSHNGPSLSEREDGVIVLDGADLDAGDAGERFAMNPTLGYDADAFAASRRRVAEFIKQVLHV
ncbi:dienelactone hydrolase family protein [Steroidobacter sp. S1-65]|uniref:Dienelactone hydrolase family protein n=1 Tax=Steroidobacter gossypii TaxID=2805490 RepID=A0ABS1WRX1_9GAMM|nr:dienelactone hydrolase family protein [Steroidobacter gossypii]MBM0103709.1 dienelactone hydrolase family protein [Steroidobacter gossypii]